MFDQDLRHLWPRQGRSSVGGGGGRDGQRTASEDRLEGGGGNEEARTRTKNNIATTNHRGHGVRTGEGGGDALFVRLGAKADETKKDTRFESDEWRRENTKHDNI